LVEGQTTGIWYPCIFLGEINPLTATTVYAVMVTAAIDAGLSISVGGGAGAGFWVVADSGVRIVGDAVLSASVAPAGGLTPTLTVQVGGTDGNDLRALKVDSAGELIISTSTTPPLNPTKSTGTVAVTSAGVTLIAAPSSGNNYLFGYTFYISSTVTELAILVGGVIVSQTFGATTGPIALPLYGYKTNLAVTAQVAGAGTAEVTMLYAPGP
jgi:hypothetical protein